MIPTGASGILQRLAGIVSSHNPGLPTIAWAGIVVLAAFAAGMIMQKALAWVFRIGVIILGVLVAWTMVGGGAGGR